MPFQFDLDYSCLDIEDDFLPPPPNVKQTPKQSAPQSRLSFPKVSLTPSSSRFAKLQSSPFATPSSTPVSDPRLRSSPTNSSPQTSVPSPSSLNLFSQIKPSTLPSKSLPAFHIRISTVLADLNLDTSSAPSNDPSSLPPVSTLPLLIASVESINPAPYALSVVLVDVNNTEYHADIHTSVLHEFKVGVGDVLVLRSVCCFNRIVLQLVIGMSSIVEVRSFDCNQSIPFDYSDLKMTLTQTL
ncbi:hypothetical protein GEMRC1_008958 [Eukaryota sp. GEM-RC1]